MESAAQQPPARRTTWDGDCHSRPAVVRIDALLNATKVSIGQVDSIKQRYPGARGIRQLRVTLDLADGGAESPQETRARLALVQSGMARPVTPNPCHEQRLEFLAAKGWLIARVSARQLRYQREVWWCGGYATRSPTGAVHSDAERTVVCGCTRRFCAATVRSASLGLYSTPTASMMFSRAARRAGGTEPSRLSASAPTVKTRAIGLGRKSTLKFMMSALTRL